MAEKVLLGDEAVALGAIHSGLSNGYGYPGTPSSEIMEYLIKYSQKTGNIHASWCSNEKTAYEDAIGVSLAGKRAIVTMKHVGLNVAADPFINSALLKINGGLVIVVADDPGMHSSQDEQDSRFFADFAKVPCFEPVNQQEAYEMTGEAFEVSEKYHVPVMIRLVTRLAHSRAVVVTGKEKEQNRMKKAEDKKTWMLLPALARKQWVTLLGKYKEFKKDSESSLHNPLYINPDFKKYGIITSGLGKNYYLENIPELSVKPSHLHVGFYPYPEEKIKRLAENVEKIIVIEEGYPFLEERLRGILKQPVEIEGKIDGKVPQTGELNPDNIRPALGLPVRKTLAEVEALPGRPPQLCQGCPHIDSYNAIKGALASYSESVVTSDIGCYALGALPPYSAIESIICMGASVGTAKGAAEAGLKPAVAVIGDSTFYHSGMTALVDAVAANTPMTLVILDNCIVAMTGGQETVVPSSRLFSVVKGLGVDPAHIKTIIPLKKNHEENTAVLKEEIAYEGLSVILSVRECIEETKRQLKKGKANK
ncbi:MAG: thiamine pyrophosphate-dependent enzyme [Spirochaetia bacterium]|jgi:indolepyruvate ferredoxin oxidoreductase alpha subunit|nr:thiamine pyrophosphate-dependent enzyme [Spirochaetia bacterium]